MRVRYTLIRRSDADACDEAKRVGFDVVEVSDNCVELTPRQPQAPELFADGIEQLRL